MSFYRFAVEDSVINSELVISPTFNTSAGDVLTISTFYSSSTYNNFYTQVYSSSSLENPQFSVQFGHLKGSGSLLINPNIDGKSYSRVNYGSYRNLIFGTENTNFIINSATSSAMFFIAINRNRYKESLKPGSINLAIDGEVYTDDSATDTTPKFHSSNKYHNMVDSSGTHFGFIYPDMGLIAITASVIGDALVSSNTSVKNENNLINTLNTFSLQSQETISSRYFFVRVKNSEFNYTTNPSIIDDNGNLLYPELIDNPRTFLTTVGLYNDKGDLLAISKLSKPLLKDFTKESLLRVKLDY